MTKRVSIINENDGLGSKMQLKTFKKIYFTKENTKVYWQISRHEKAWLDHELQLCNVRHVKVKHSKKSHMLRGLLDHEFGYTVEPIIILGA